MKVLIVEDEELAVEKLEYMLKQVEPNAQVVGCTGSIEATIAWFQRNPAPDIILMDVELSDGQSFEIFNRVAVDSTVIFTTSYDEYALKAFKVNSIDYLLKPIQKDELSAAFEKYRRVMKNSTASGSEMLNIHSLVKDLQTQLQAKELRKRFLVKVGNKLLSVDVESISYFYVNDKAVCFKTKESKNYVVDYTMDEIEGMTDKTRFFRINRSFLVSIESIQQMHDFFNSRIILQLNPAFPKDVIVSREKVNDFKIWMGK